MDCFSGRVLYCGTRWALNYVDFCFVFAENYESCYDDYAKALEMLKNVVEPDSRILAEL